MNTWLKHPEDDVKQHETNHCWWNIVDLQCGEKPSEETIQSKCTRGGGHPEETYDVHCGISPVDVLPLDQRFYTYPGSLTTPPCYESVQWIVYKCPIKVSRKVGEQMYFSLTVWLLFTVSFGPRLSHWVSSSFLGVQSIAACWRHWE